MQVMTTAGMLPPPFYSEYVAMALCYLFLLFLVLGVDFYYVVIRPTLFPTVKKRKQMPIKISTPRWSEDDSEDGFKAPKKTTRVKKTQTAPEPLTVSTAFDALAPVDPPPLARQKAHARPAPIDVSTDEAAPIQAEVAPTPRPRGRGRSAPAPFPLEEEAPKPSQSPPARRRSKKQPPPPAEAPLASAP
ncbi:MAG: hypothetical protein CMP58_03555 [Flavobacteriales bacterium]|nr:hypothetical protein [Flavobacteriales bacterium]